MSMITVIWSGATAAILTIGVIYLAVWFQNPERTAQLLFAITTISVAGLTPTELGMMQAANAAEWAEWVRWIHLPIFGALVGGILFVRVYLGTGRDWLMWAFIAIRTIILCEWSFMC